MRSSCSLLIKIFLSLAVCVISLSLGACDFQAIKSFFIPEITEPVITEEGFSVYDGIQPRYYGANPDEPVSLINNEAAENPTWHELEGFLIADITDKNSYLPGIRVCSEFAAELHNNAEKAGIRAAWVALDFEDDTEGHALNAFETTDHGLVFVDCTGGIPVIETPAIDEETGEIIEENKCFDSHDKKVFVQIGRQCGSIGLDVPSGFDYGAYLDYIDKWKRLEEMIAALENKAEDYSSKLEEYNRRVVEYEQLVAGRTVIEDQEEYHKLQSMYNEIELIGRELERDREELMREAELVSTESENLGNCRRMPLGIVESVEIYW